MENKKQKVIIWGYPLFSHTHSYIHAGLFKAFVSLGYETYWFNDNEYPMGFDYENCIFFTEGYADNNIPIKKTSIYFVHVLRNKDKYQSVKKLIDVRYLLDNISDVNYNYTFKYVDGEKLDSGVYFKSNEIDEIYMCWATNLLPNEIDYDTVNVKRSNVWNFIGSISPQGHCENFSNINPLIKICERNGIQFNHINPWSNPVSEEENIRLIQKSIFSPDLRGKQHNKWGYISCRIMKSISYGQLGITNSKSVYDFLGDDTIIYSDDFEELYDLSMSKVDDKDVIIKQMMNIKTNHTFVNRVIGLMNYIKKIN